MVKNPKRVGTNSSFLKSVMSSPAVKNPTQKTNPIQIFVDEAVPFYRAAKNLQVSAIHVNPANNKNPQSKPTPVKLPKKYKDFVDVFEKINADQLPAHSPYHCPIDLEEGHSPPFGPIYGLSNRNSKPCVITLLKTLPRGSFSIPSLQPAPQFCLLRRRMAPFDSVWIIVDSIR
jgi:hypothetical protein